MARVLLTGASGFIGAGLLPRLLADGHDVRAWARTPSRVAGGIAVVQGDASTGERVDEALDGVEVAYFLIHSMAGSVGPGFADVERRTAELFAEGCRRAGVRRVVYLGGLVPPAGHVARRHLASRLAVEEVLLGAAPEVAAFRASIVVGAGSRSFRFLVRLVARVPVLPLPAWGQNRTQPIDERDALAFLHRAADHPAIDAPLSLDIAGPDVVTYGEMTSRIAELLLIGRPVLRLPVSLTPVASRVAAAIASEDVGLIEPLMEGLEADLLPRDDRAAALLGVRLHRYDAAVEHALRDLEEREELPGR